MEPRGEFERWMMGFGNHTIATIRLFEKFEEARQSFPAADLDVGSVNSVLKWYYHYFGAPESSDELPLCFGKPYSAKYAPAECDTCPLIDQCCLEAAKS